ncbi:MULTISPECIES: class I adenylate-forming enzyme family protein [Actinoplanes]|uniref:class I adenylate-forming enzyme family protein n=1 Tax=Actinoplanes TaxID=1865 RepID=UPI0005F2EA8C|nr:MULTISPECIES: class I adenylate-forming enzyme family protein [Actinoplanes]GLY05399.1 putative fatty-acid-CoA ligase FadD [Actinoplanes sp. NBRC 101535]
MKPLDLGTLFDTLADRNSPTVVHLERPFDVAPDGGTAYTIPDLAGLVRDLAAGIAAAGVRPGQHVAVCKPNHWDIMLLACAAIRIGAVPALLSDHLSAAALRILLERLDPALLIAGPDTGWTGRTVAVRDLRGSGADPVVHRRPDDAPLIVNHTSGTTGVPKLVVHSTATLIRRLADFEASPMPLLTATRKDVVASAISFAHGRAVTWTPSALWHRPRKLLIVTGDDPRTALPLFTEHRPTIVECLPATYVRWQNDAAARRHGPFRDVRLFISTFDAVHPSTVRGYLAASHRRFPLWLQGWGQTETGPLTLRVMTRRSVDRRRLRPTTRHLGWPVPFRTRLKVVDPETLIDLPAGQPGLILARTGARCLGYVAEEERWHSKVDGRWFHTGDIGLVDRLGGVRLLDREVDTAPGLSCMEIEDLIDDRLPEVTECVLLGSPGRLPLPVLTTTSGRLDEDAWAEAVADLPPLGRPVLLPEGDMPRTATGKVRRLELRGRLAGLAAGHGSGRWT